ncbi:MAG TPA: hypothetical protein VIH99_07005 [Bdellovibrionota bacterium]
MKNLILALALLASFPAQAEAQSEQKQQILSADKLEASCGGLFKNTLYVTKDGTTVLKEKQDSKIDCQHAEYRLTTAIMAARATKNSIRLQADLRALDGGFKIDGKLVISPKDLRAWCTYDGILVVERNPYNVYRSLSYWNSQFICQSEAVKLEELFQKAKDDGKDLTFSLSGDARKDFRINEDGKNSAPAPAANAGEEQAEDASAPAL